MSEQDNQQKVLLLIDDEVNLQQLIKMTLESKKYHVETANNGLEGMAKLETLKPDLIILDLNMPKMGGVEFYRRICDGKNKPKYPVLVLTARANMEQLFKELDIDGFMAKPFEIVDLLHEVDAIIQKNLNGTGPTTLSGTGGVPTIYLINEDNEA